MCLRRNIHHSVVPSVAPDISQSESAARNDYASGGSLSEEFGEMLDEFFWAFSCFMCCGERPAKMSPKIPPNLSLHVSSRPLWLKYQNFISASFWSLECPPSLMANLKNIS